MVNYNFKAIAVVPTAEDFVDIILSKTQRKTPTVVRKGWQITRIRAFYLRKVKFTQQSYHDKLTAILDQFPRLEDLHPFYADLIDVLYSKDHYKLALGQINTARTTIDNIAKDYQHLLKYGDSLYRCKQLKRAALGRMCTLMKKLKASLQYLEQVRQHLSRLPTIDPTERTIILTGYPNVGKSLFLNKVSRANVDVQPYAFTTKSIYVGHCFDHDIRYQVIDTPGLLDHPLEAMNIIERQAVTALAHLQSCVLFFIDISETCGYSIQQQVKLYHNIKPLFENKPILVVANKIDLKPLSSVESRDRSLVEGVAKDRDTKLIPMSNVSEEGVHQVKTEACKLLLEYRVAKKLQGKRVNDIKNRIHVARPVPRDDRDRPVNIPDSVVARRNGTTMDAAEANPRKTQKDVELEHGGPGVYNFDLRNHHMLANDEWKFDLIPEILDGKNIADFVDPEIEARLDEAEREEALLEQQADQDNAMEDDSDLDEEDQELVDRIRTKKALLKNESALKKTLNKPVMPRTARPKPMHAVEAELNEMGLDAEHVRGRSRKRKASVLASQRVPSESGAARSRSRTQSRPRAPQEEGFRNVRQKAAAQRMGRVAQRGRNLDAKKGEADRHVYDLKPKHLYSGKSTIGKSDFR